MLFRKSERRRDQAAEAADTIGSDSSQPSARELAHDLGREPNREANREFQGQPEAPPPGEGALPVAGAGPGRTHTQSFIDASLTIVGDLHSDGDVRIDGNICGNVRCAQLIVNQGAAITGSVTAEQAIVRGRVRGTIRSPAVVIQETAHVESEITYGMLAIDDGAFFEGSVRHSSAPMEAEPTSPLADLEQATRPAEASGDKPNGPPGRQTAVVSPPRVPDPTAANGTTPLPNGHHGPGE